MYVCVLGLGNGGGGEGGRGAGGQENCQRLNHPESYTMLSGNYPFRPNKGVHPGII